MHRTVRSGKEPPKDQYTLTVPAPIARALRDAGITQFAVDLTEDGIVYRPVLTGPEDRPLPTWLTQRRKHPDAPDRQG